MSESKKNKLNNDCGQEGNKKVKLSRLNAAAQADVTIVVGKRVFKENSGFLGYVSGYFHGALGSGMKEAQTKRFEFPDKDPDEWEMFIGYLKPLSNQTITESNVEVMLRWCDEFCVEIEKADLDAAFGKNVSLIVHQTCDSDEKKKQQVRDIIEALEKSIKYGLLESQQTLVVILKKFIEDPPCSSAFDEDTIDRVVGLVNDNEGCKSCLWRSLEFYIPETMVAEALANNSLAKIITYGMNVTEHIHSRLKLQVEAEVKLEVKDELKAKLTSKLPSLLYDRLPRNPSDSRCSDILWDILHDESTWAEF